MDPSGHDAGEKATRQEAPHRRRYARHDPGRPHPARRYPGSRRRLAGVEEVRRLFPFVERVFADGGYQGAATAAAVRELGEWHLEIVKRSDTAKGFEVLPKRWIVERTFGWLGRCRRLAKDFENLSRMSLAFLRLAPILLMLRRITRHRKS
ncbi:transposase [Nitrospirillum iridis]|uniref:transposase n=1 Tax=Nitrospirillum iridis TaxID=765888 RepID=UPI003CCE3C4B